MSNYSLKKTINEITYACLISINTWTRVQVQEAIDIEELSPDVWVGANPYQMVHHSGGMFINLSIKTAYIWIKLFSIYYW